MSHEHGKRKDFFGHLTLSDTDPNFDEEDIQETSEDIVEDTFTDFRKQSASVLFSRRFASLLYKQWLCTVKNGQLLIPKFLVPIMLTGLAVFYIQFFCDPPARTIAEWTLQLDDYYKTEQIMVHSSLKQEFVRTYGSEIRHLLYVQQSDYLEEDLISFSESNYDDYLENLILGIGAVITEKEGNQGITVIYGRYSIFTDSSPVFAMNVLNNLKFHMLKKPVKFIISTYLDPLPHGITYNFRDIIDSILGDSVISAFIITIGLTVMTSSFVAFPLEERIIHFKQLQIMAGVKPILYWFSFFVWDFFMYSFVATIILISLTFLDPNGSFQSWNFFGAAALFLLSFGCSNIVFSYFVSLLVSTLSGGHAVLTTLNVLAGIVPFAIVQIDVGEFLSAEGAWRYIKFIQYPMYLIPATSLMNGLMHLLQIAFLNNICQSQIGGDTDRVGCHSRRLQPLLRRCCRGFRYNSDVYGTEYEPLAQMHYMKLTQEYRLYSYTAYKVLGSSSVGADILVFVCLTAFYVILISFGELNIKGWLLYKQSISDPGNVIFLDGDVIKERDRVEALIENENVASNAVVLSEISKRFGKYAAINDLHFGVRHGECFGILGSNASGKTVLLDMIVGNLTPTSGDIYVLGEDYFNPSYDIFTNIGYCPQHDALLQKLNCYEILTLFATLRGVQEFKINEEVLKWIIFMGLQEIAQYPCGEYSLGNKRRLSASVALIGHPPIVVLDEPTSGVDPIAKRLLWNVLGKVKDQGHSVVLSSHSMDECEELCTRVGILVNGQFQCIGTVQELKTNFAAGYTITLQFPEKKSKHDRSHAKSQKGNSVKTDGPKAEETNTNIEEMNAKVEGTSAKVEGTNSKVEGTNSKVEGTNAKAEGTNVKVEGTNAKVEGTNAKVQGANAKVEGTNSKVKIAKVKVDDPNRTIEGLETDKKADQVKGTKKPKKGNETEERGSISPEAQRSSVSKEPPSAAESKKKKNKKDDKSEEKVTVSSNEDDTSTVQGVKDIGVHISHHFSSAFSTIHSKLISIFPDAQLTESQHVSIRNHNIIRFKYSCHV